MYIYICIYIADAHLPFIILHHAPPPAAFAQLLRDHGGGGPSNFFRGWSH